jgi:dTDP-glucose 4,6-dehydratase
MGKTYQKTEAFSMNKKKSILITGGAGFIGSHVVRRFVNNYPEYVVVNADKLTYAGNLENLSDIEKKSNYFFEKTDIVNKQSVLELFSKYNFDGIIHLAAESHVDRSITSPDEFVFTNIIGTLNLLNSARENWKEDYKTKLFYHI